MSNSLLSNFNLLLYHYFDTHYGTSVWDPSGHRDGKHCQRLAVQPKLPKHTERRLCRFSHSIVLNPDDPWRTQYPSSHHFTQCCCIPPSITHGVRNQTTSTSLILKLVFFKGHVPDLEHQAEQAWYRHGESAHPCHNNCKWEHKHLWPHIVQGSVQAVEAHLISAVWTDRRGGKRAQILLHLQIQLPCGFILRVFLGHRTHDKVRVQRSHCWKLLPGGVLLCHTWATLAGCKHCIRREKI